jgi:hypothetical protein
VATILARVESIKQTTLQIEQEERALLIMKTKFENMNDYDYMRGLEQAAKMIQG